MLKEIFSGILDIFIPPRHTEQAVASLAPLALQSLLTERGLPYHDQNVSALIWELKYFASPRAGVLAGHLLAPQILEIAAEELGTPLLIPVPMHALRRRERGHNQTELLAEAVVARLNGGLDYAPRALTRTTYTTNQQGLERGKRLKNVAGSMHAAAEVKGRVCIVVDDVTTTGATFKECKRALLAGGARRVHTIALAYS